uniref:Uncharacterized protein n=1 Tax=Romanomermis culicivorax TaxID=13658 RepID=A0A915HIU0_ROMCU
MEKWRLGGVDVLAHFLFGPPFRSGLYREADEFVLETLPVEIMVDALFDEQHISSPLIKRSACSNESNFLNFALAKPSVWALH